MASAVDSPVQCVGLDWTVILLIDGLGRSETHLWKSWEWGKRSTADWQVEGERGGLCVCLCEYLCVLLHACGQDRMKRYSRSHSCINSWAQQLAPAFPPMTFSQPPYPHTDNSKQNVYHCFWACTACIWMIHDAALCVLFFGLVLYIYAWICCGQQLTCSCCLPPQQQNVHTCNLNMHNMTPQSVQNRRPNCLR